MAHEWNNELQADYDRIYSIGEECISGPELQSLLLKKGRGSQHSHGFILYDGFEPSGRMHIAQGVFKAMNVNKCTISGTNATFVFWVADWFALMNDKMGGDLDKIKTVGRYLIEVWKAAGMNLTHVIFKWASEEITAKATEYWPIMLDVARRFNITRIKKCCQIMGRLEGSLTAAQVLYPIMQCTDVFFLKADICQLGVDQRKVNMLAREYCDAAKRSTKPVILSHHMLYGLKAGQEKMSKSDPDSAIFMEDAAIDVQRKIMNAYCPSVELETALTTISLENDDAGKESLHLSIDKLKNPCLDYIQYIIFSPDEATFHAGDKVYTTFQEVRNAFLNGLITEEQLKKGLIDELNKLLEPVRHHFTHDETARELLAKVQQYKKEDVSQSTAKVIRRLNLVQIQMVPENSHMVVAQLPTPNPTLQMALDLLTRLRSGDPSSPKVLLLPDWSARVCNAVDADPKVVSAFYLVLVKALNLLDPTLMQNVTVLLQSEAILKDPSNYWISVINVGRNFKLEDVMGPALHDADSVGIVIARLMMVGDVAGVTPSTLSLSNDAEADVLKKLVNDFFVMQLPGLTPPTVQKDPTPSIQLQPTRESAALVTENDEYYLLDDPKVWFKQTWFKYFCFVLQPTNSCILLFLRCTVNRS
jgi:tyrosyl-tRNA synthetase